jgi:GAF domain-containing protein
VQYQDVAAAIASEGGQPEHPLRQASVDLGGARSLVVVPLRKDEAVFGLFTIYRQEVLPFTDKQIALLQNFAGQAVIAMENARLITETREALAQQTATAEVLHVINSSRDDLAPVFDAILDRAMRLCGASHAHLFAFDGEELHPVAVRGDPGFGEWLRQQRPMRPMPGSSVYRLQHDEPFVHMLDATKTEAYRDSPLFRELMDRSGCRTSVNVPLRKDGELLGTIHLYRRNSRDR